jgi:hypothetical protein
MKADIPKTGWPPGLLQDDSSEFSRWLSSRMDARKNVRSVAKEIEESRVNPNSNPPPNNNNKAT